MGASLESIRYTQYMYNAPVTPYGGGNRGCHYYNNLNSCFLLNNASQIRPSNSKVLHGSSMCDSCSNPQLHSPYPRSFSPPFPLPLLQLVLDYVHTFIFIGLDALNLLLPSLANFDSSGRHIPLSSWCRSYLTFTTISITFEDVYQNAGVSTVS